MTSISEGVPWERSIADVVREVFRDLGIAALISRLLGIDQGIGGSSYTN